MVGKISKRFDARAVFFIAKKKNENYLEEIKK